jgi:hypothetical protein
MKKLVLLMALLAFLVAVPMAMAQDKVNCCVAGKCSQMDKAECEKAKGTVVKDCAECK